MTAAKVLAEALKVGDVVRIGSMVETIVAFEFVKKTSIHMTTEFPSDIDPDETVRHYYSIKRTNRIERIA